MRILVIALVLLTAPLARAIESASFRISDGTFNSGGHADPLILTSSSFRVSLGAIGDGIVRHRPLASVSYHFDGGFVDAYAPPGEVRGVHWIDRTTLVWGPVKSAGIYGLYSGSVAATQQNPPANCLLTDVAGTEVTLQSRPVAGMGLFYLVTARNHVAEEGTRGYASDGTERPAGTTCP